MQWLTTYSASNEHDLCGLRENFNARARWKAAINSARAMHRFGSSQSRVSTSSKSSGGWGDSGEEDEKDEQGGHKEEIGNPGENDNVRVIGPEDDVKPANLPPDSPSSKRSSDSGVLAKGVEDTVHVEERGSSDVHLEDDIQMPGSFLPEEQESTNRGESSSQESWSQIFRKLGGNL